MTQPIGIFDSGMGGLTVARAIRELLPRESILYFGDSKRCPYGVQSQADVRRYVAQITQWFKLHDVKMLVIACNTATAAGLDLAQRMLDVPVIGVIRAGAEAVVHATRTRRVGVLATEGTYRSGEYERAIKAIDSGVQIWQAPSTRVVNIVEDTLASSTLPSQDWVDAQDLFDTPQNNLIAQEDVAPLMNHSIEAVILGCTHFPLFRHEFQKALGADVTIVSSAQETANQVQDYLRRGRDCAPKDATPTYSFATTSDNVDAFAKAGSYVFGKPIEEVLYVELDELEKLTPSVIEPRQ